MPQTRTSGTPEPGSEPALDAFRSRFARALDSLGVARREPLVVAVSGGCDSMVLLDVLARCEVNSVVAHLDHGTRGADSLADATLVGEAAKSYGFPCVIERPAIDPSGTGFEDRARATRYAFFAEVARAHHARAVAVAHHGDDQAETVLDRLLRGAGPDGLAGMQPRAPLPGDESRLIDVVRPLLGETRSTIRAFADRAGVRFREDESNHDLRFRRNRIRHEVLPMLRRSFNPAVDDALRRAASLSQETQRIVVAAATAALAPLLRREGTGWIEVDRRAFRRLEPSLAALVVREAIRRLDPTAPPILGRRTTHDLVGAIRGSRRPSARWIVRQGLQAELDLETVRLSRLSDAGGTSNEAPLR